MKILMCVNKLLLSSVCSKQQENWVVNVLQEVDIDGEDDDYVQDFEDSKAVQTMSEQEVQGAEKEKMYTGEGKSAGTK